MLDDTGKKLISSANILFWVITVVSVIGGIALLVISFFGNDMISEALAVIFIGIISAYVISLIIKGLGQLVENSAECKEILKKIEHNQVQNPNRDLSKPSIPFALDIQNNASKSIASIAEYALKYQTDSGKRDYLGRMIPSLSKDERELLSSVYALEGTELKEALEKIANKN